MAAIDFERISEHTANINGVMTAIWRIRRSGTIDEYYIKAAKAHAKLGGSYWADTRDLIPLDKVKLPDDTINSRYQPRIEALYQEIECGMCGIMNSLNIDSIQSKEMQGAHNCKNKKCNSTICIVIGKRITLKNGAIAGNIVRK